MVEAGAVFDFRALEEVQCDDEVVGAVSVGWASEDEEAEAFDVAPCETVWGEDCEELAELVQEESLHELLVIGFGFRGCDDEALADGWS